MLCIRSGECPSSWNSLQWALQAESCPAFLQVAQCHRSCLTCDKKTGACTSCPARFGLDYSTPKRCVPVRASACWGILAGRACCLHVQAYCRERLSARKFTCNCLRVLETFFPGDLYSIKCLPLQRLVMQCGAQQAVLLYLFLRCAGKGAWACLDCNKDYKRCSRCIMGKYLYLDNQGGCHYCKCLVLHSLLPAACLGLCGQPQRHIRMASM